MKLQFQAVKASSLISQSTSTKAKPLVSLEEKIDRRLKSAVNRRNRLYIYHFKTIEHEKLLFLIDGRGKVLASFDNSDKVKAERAARVLAISLLPEDKKLSGGYLFN